LVVAREKLAAGVHGKLGDPVPALPSRRGSGAYLSLRQVQQCPNEPHICHNLHDGDRLIVRASTQVPWHIRRHVSRIVGMKQNKVHVIKQRVGGGFGSKQDMLLRKSVPGQPVSPDVR